MTLCRHSRPSTKAARIVIAILLTAKVVTIVIAGVGVPVAFPLFVARLGAVVRVIVVAVGLVPTAVGRREGAHGALVRDKDSHALAASFPVGSGPGQPPLDGATAHAARLGHRPGDARDARDAHGPGGVGGGLGQCHRRGGCDEDGKKENTEGKLEDDHGGGQGERRDRALVDGEKSGEESVWGGVELAQCTRARAGERLVAGGRLGRLVRWQPVLGRGGQLDRLLCPSRHSVTHAPGTQHRLSRDACPGTRPSPQPHRLPSRVRELWRTPNVRHGCPHPSCPKRRSPTRSVHQADMRGPSLTARCGCSNAAVSPRKRRRSFARTLGGGHSTPLYLEQRAWAAQTRAFRPRPRTAANLPPAGYPAEEGYRVSCGRSELGDILL